MSEHNETLADIVAELREDGNAVMSENHDDDCWSNLEAGQIYYALADRIEAAAKRERATTVGNAAAMRELVRRIVKSLGGNAEVLPTTMTPHEVAILNQCRAALAKPPRNCDVGTAREQSARFDKFCYDHRSYEKGCGGCPFLTGEPCCELAWAQMSYEEGGAK